VSRKSVLSIRARGSVDSQSPLRAHFLWVGGALLVLLFAADSLLPAPLPSKLFETHSTLPPIRITSELKGPEAVVIDTSQPDFLPMLPVKEIAAAPSQLLSSDVADAVRQPPLSLSEQADGSDGMPAIPTHVRETLAQLGPGVSDRAGSSRRRVGLAQEPRRNFAQTRSEKRRRPARTSEFRYHSRMVRFTEPRPRFVSIGRHGPSHTLIRSPVSFSRTATGFTSCRRSDC
jgi:hypothetical protein